MSTIIEIPITAEDVNVIEERKSVELSGEKFKELLNYLTYIEDKLSIAEFDFGNEQRFSELLLSAFINSMRALTLVLHDGRLIVPFIEEIKNFKEYLIGEVDAGSLSEDYLRRFDEMTKKIIGASIEEIEEAWIAQTQRTSDVTPDFYIKSDEKMRT